MPFFWRLAAFIVILSGNVWSAQADLKIFITNDVHGYMAEDPARGRIGYARLKALTDAETEAGHTVFLMDSGDAFSGSAYAQADHGRSIAELMGMMGYRVLTPGNHAFDYNEVEDNPLHYSEVLLETVRVHSKEKLDAVAENLSRNGQNLPGISRAPVIVYDETADKPDGVRLIVTGLTTPYYASRPGLKESGYNFRLYDNPAATREKILADLGKSVRPYVRPHDVVIVLAHLGWPGDRKDYLNGPDVAAVPNVDFVADGHTHQVIAPHQIGNAIYGNGGRYLESFLEITIGDDGQRQMKLKTYNDLAGLEPDRLIAEKVAEVDHRHGFSEIISELPDTELFSDHGLRTDNVNTALGRLICFAMIHATGADMAFHNTGGIRAGLPAGTVTMRDLYDVLPFGDELVIINMSGREILERFGRGSSRGRREWPQFYGLRVYAWRGEAGDMIVTGIRKADGSPLELDHHYRVAMNGFMARYLDCPMEQHGEMIEALRQELKSGFHFEELRSNHSLFIFPTQEEAQVAWEKGAP